MYPLKTLAYGMLYSMFVDYFQISIQFGIRLCREFDCAIQALYTKEYLKVPDEPEFCDKSIASLCPWSGWYAGFP